LCPPGREVDLIRTALFLLAAVPAAAAAWDCPACGTANQGQICTECHLPEPPEGMAWVPGDTITVDGILFRVEPFFIDSSRVTYRDVLPWLNSEATSIDRLAEIVSGQYDESLNFLRYTPFTGSEDGSGITVPAGCLDLPVTSFTWPAASDYLRSTGRRMPSTAEMALAARHGMVADQDIFEIMSAWASMMEASMGSLLGRISAQAMFAGYSSRAERAIWEWTSDAPGYGDPPVPPACMVVFRPSGTGLADRSSGYFNIGFRGAVTDPSTL
jgi:hypothetical protein